MNDDLVLRAEKIGKCFKIYASPWDRLKEWVSPGRKVCHHDFWALKDLSFELRRGEFLGIMGQNGAGKSTLLKILTGVLHPTTGSCQLKGRLLSMLELGMDFHPQISGRENIVRTAELLGFPDGCAQARLEQIYEFSELGDFFDRPVRLYSTGMRARLAFSLFTFLESDLLILDEVLAVGDIFFRQKCYARLEELIAQGLTIIMSTHSIEAVRQFCDSMLLLDKGQLLHKGEVAQGIQKYIHIRNMARSRPVTTAAVEDLGSPRSRSENDFAWPEKEILTPGHCPESDWARLIRFAVCNKNGTSCANFVQGDQACFYCEFQLKHTIGIPIPRIIITNQFNVVIHAKSFYSKEDSPNQVCQGDYLRFCRKITLALAAGEYIFGFALKTVESDARDSRTASSATNTSSQKQRLLWRDEQVGAFSIAPRAWNWEKRMHGGLCDLPGAGRIQVVPNTLCSSSC
ncbi:polysaccharide/polyol phosphate ABC transporter ATP-binding protein [candidate division KSB3 bacterium]|uniref:Polysaccharide/polyol phosphate ABC transporter ATP-binding protein n=1 Tax=candidate division KSB3 bacterium TaxID=2044937 RepID=A0A2G6E5G8_9BACT|nr:MAG: polysaccharide/polyol phosphate ABC transporter ATP-binding protein [candidate division KSB3 bacterium]PIE29848.1 MAG: polysaccharide/polyol phosphate ABC transporter ATP-binding protein [candidate division KSB3 bacterium]